MTTTTTPAADRRTFAAWLWYAALLTPALGWLVWLAGDWLAVAALAALLLPVVVMQVRSVGAWLREA